MLNVSATRRERLFKREKGDGMVYYMLVYYTGKILKEEKGDGGILCTVLYREYAWGTQQCRHLMRKMR